jgi:aminocarboxymuconate-semialdehyde decarboxylase
MIIDCQWHLYPRAFYEALYGRERYPKASPAGDDVIYEPAPGVVFRMTRQYTDLETQMELSEQAGIQTVVSATAGLGIDSFPASEGRDLALLLNELAADAEKRYPGRFIGLAALPLRDTDLALEVLDDAVGRLGLRGTFFHSNIGGQGLDAQRLDPLYGRIEQLGLPLFLHPTRSVMASALQDYGLDFMVGYMFDTTVAALRLVFGGVLDRFPGLEIVHPHLGAAVPFLAGRIDHESSQPYALGKSLERKPSEYLSQFYADIVGNSSAALELALKFYGSERILFGSDFPWWDPQIGIDLVESTCDENERRLVYETNARRLLGV